MKYLVLVLFFTCISCVDGAFVPNYTGYEFVNDSDFELWFQGYYSNGDLSPDFDFQIHPNETSVALCRPELVGRRSFIFGDFSITNIQLKLPGNQTVSIKSNSIYDNNNKIFPRYQFLIFPQKSDYDFDGKVKNKKVSVLHTIYISNSVIESLLIKEENQ